MKIENNVLVQVKNEDIKHGKLVIPEGVTEIEDVGLRNIPELTEIIMPDSLVKIGDKAFSLCEHLRNVKFSENLISIGQDAFYKCGSLRTINLPDSVQEIKKTAFVGCESLENITLPKSLKRIEKMTFAYCDSLDNLIIPKNIEYIGDSAFYSCKALSNVTIEDGLKTLDAFAFSSCGQLSNINLPNSIQEINKNAFSYCNNLEKITLPENLKTLGNCAFASSGINSVVIPESVENMGYGVFRFCRNLEQAYLPNNFVSVENETFSFCKELKEVHLPKNVKSIGELAFTQCTNLKNIDLPESVQIINKNAFKDCKLESIYLPDTIKQIEPFAFSGCAFSSVKIPKNIKIINYNTFENCENLENVILPEDLHLIGKNAFENCKNLKEISFPENLSEIDDFAFNNCSNLESAKLPNSVTKIGNNAFSNCSKLKDITLSKSLKSIGNNAFQFTPITSIDIPSSVENIGNFAFDGCSNLGSVRLSNSLTSISNGLFQRCANLKEITLPESIKTIGSYAFALSDFKQIEIPQNVKTIGNGAFYNNKDLTTIKLNEGLKTIKDQAFDMCPNLTELNIPSSVAEMGSARDFMFFDKTENGFKLSNEQTTTSLPCNQIKIGLGFLSRHWDKKSTLLKEQNNYNVVNLYNEVISKLPEDKIDEFLNSHNMTFLKKMNINNNPENLTSMYNFIYNMGIVYSPVEINGKRIDYAQKTSEFLRLLDEKEICKLYDFKNIFKTMEVQGLKPEFVDFFIKDFDKLYEVEQKDPGFIARCYNDFEKVQKTNTNHHGSQRQLKPTVQKFQDYFKENKFFGVVDERTKLISDTISPYFNEQLHFDNALAINKERISKKTPNNILSFHLKEENPFENIDKMASEIGDLQKNTLENMIDTATNEFTFDWLEKNDPENYILGNLCSCCAHLDGAGYGIMHASIVHPNIQNLVIRNKNNEIIAKSTLYINPSECYGVFNNVEVNTSITPAEKKKIFEKYIKGVNLFAEHYNKEHPDKQLRQINIGLSNNDLLSELEVGRKKTHPNLQAISYAKYGYGDHDYNGDSTVDQMIVWKNKLYQIENEK